MRQSRIPPPKSARNKAKAEIKYSDISFSTEEDSSNFNFKLRSDEYIQSFFGASLDMREPKTEEELNAQSIALNTAKEVLGTEFVLAGVYDVTEPRLAFAEPQKIGLGVVLYPTYGGLPVYSFNTTIGSDSGAEAAGFSRSSNAYDYMPPQENIHAVVKNGEVIEFCWSSPAKQLRLDNENVELLPFEKVMELFDKNVSHQFFIDEGHRTIYHVTDITLSSMRVKKHDAEGYYMLPVWDFTGYALDAEDSKVYDEDIGSAKKFWSSQSLLTINAIDGSIIDRNLGY